MAAAVVGTKRCSKCGVEKPIDDFPKRFDRTKGRRGQCRDCFNAKDRVRERAKYRDAVPSVSGPHDSSVAMKHAQREIAFSDWLVEQGIELNMRDWMVACERVTCGASYDDAVRAVRLVNMDYPEKAEEARNAAAV